MSSQELKEYKTIDELIAYLREDKRIIVNDANKHYLEEINYITIINPFKELFSNGRDKQGKHIYIKDVDFKNIIKAYQIDKNASVYLHKLIGDFEIKFKNIVFTELCSKYYSLGDINCIRYIEDIKKYLDTLEQNQETKQYKNKFLDDLPILFSNINRSLTKDGYKNNDYFFEARLDLLKTIYSNSVGKTAKGENEEIKNHLITHYLESQKCVPLWVIPNALTLGEISMIYSMLDEDMQITIYYKMSSDKRKFQNKSYLYKDMVRFNGKLEFLRNLRNKINHYEPIFPLFVNSFQKLKEFENSILAKTLQLIDKNINITPFSKELSSNLDIDIQVNTNNIKQVRILEFLQQIAK